MSFNLGNGIQIWSLFDMLPIFHWSDKMRAIWGSKILIIQIDPIF